MVISSQLCQFTRGYSLFWGSAFCNATFQRQTNATAIFPSSLHNLHETKCSRVGSILHQIFCEVTRTYKPSYQPAYANHAGKWKSFPNTWRTLKNHSASDLHAIEQWKRHPMERSQTLDSWPRPRSPCEQHRHRETWKPRGFLRAPPGQKKLHSQLLSLSLCFGNQNIMNISSLSETWIDLKWLPCLSMSFVAKWAKHLHLRKAGHSTQQFQQRQLNSLAVSHWKSQQFWWIKIIKSPSKFQAHQRSPKLPRNYPDGWYLVDIWMIFPWDQMISASFVGWNETMGRLAGPKVLRLAGGLKLLTSLKDNMGQTLNPRSLWSSHWLVMDSSYPIIYIYERLWKP